MFKQYGLAYAVHPNQGLPMGKSIEHIERISIEDICSFSRQFYCPANAILVIAGNIRTNETLQLVEKWFGKIPSESNTNFDCQSSLHRKKNEQKSSLKRQFKLF